MTRRRFLQRASAAAAVSVAPSFSRGQAPAVGLIDQLLAEFAKEAIVPAGGVDRTRSRWQLPGRGAAAGIGMFAGEIDPRYFRFEVEALYRCAKPRDNGQYRSVADAHVNYMVNNVHAHHPTWAIGNALEMIGIGRAQSNTPADAPAVVTKLVEAARARSVEVETLDGVKFRHFPCGYGVLKSKDAGWTNDLSMFGSGLVWAYGLTKDKTILDDAVSFAEYFVQPWRPDALSEAGYWRCGTWHETIGAWVIGPSHYTGFESTDAFGDEAAWMFSNMTCIDFLLRLYAQHRDPRYLQRCVAAAQWTFRACQFDDGAVGMCGRDDKWLGFTGDAITQVAMLRPYVEDDANVWPQLLAGAKRAASYIDKRLAVARLEDHGVEWVKRTTSTDPLCNVAMVWASLLLGWLNGRDQGWLR